jgi:hypothetical protein
MRRKQFLIESRCLLKRIPVHTSLSLCIHIVIRQNTYLFRHQHSDRDPRTPSPCSLVLLDPQGRVVHALRRLPRNFPFVVARHTLLPVSTFLRSTTLLPPLTRLYEFGKARIASSVKRLRLERGFHSLPLTTRYHCRIRIIERSHGRVLHHSWEVKSLRCSILSSGIVDGREPAVVQRTTRDSLCPTHGTAENYAT